MNPPDAPSGARGGVGHRNYAAESDCREGQCPSATPGQRIPWAASSPPAESQSQLARLAIEGGVATRLNNFARYWLRLPAEARKGHLE